MQIDWVRWGETAAALGLRLHDPIEPFTPLRSFRSNVASRGAEVVGEVLPRHWMHGVWRSAGGAPAEVLVVGEHTVAEGATVIRTYAAARIDPPLACGLSLGLGSFLLPPSPLPRRGGAVPLSPRLVLWAARAENVPRATAIMGEGASGAELSARLVAARDDDVFVTDSMAVVRADGFRTHRQHVERMLASAAGLAAAFASRRPATRADAEGARRAGEWRTAAEAGRIPFDEERMTLEGPLGGLPVTIALEGEPAGLSTFAEILLPRLGGVTLRLSPETVRTTLSTVLGGTQDIKVGRRAFDDAFVVRGFPEDDVRALLEDAHVRHAFASLATGAALLVLRDGRLTVTWARALDGRDLAGVIAAIARLGARSGGEPPAAVGPYR